MGKNVAKIDDKSKFLRIERALADEISKFLFEMGNQFVNFKNAEIAHRCFTHSIDLNPNRQESVYNLGALYNIAGNIEGAQRMFREAARMRPNDLMSRVALADVVRKLGKLEEAFSLLDEAYKIDPQNYVVFSGIALLNYDSGNLAEALQWNERALEKKPGDLHMLLNKALINMTYGNWAEYWSIYEYCLSYQKNEKMRGLKMGNSWGGEERPGETIVVISDQGSGDAIQFSRYLSEAKQLGKFGKLIYHVQPDVAPLMRRLDYIDEVIGFGERLEVPSNAFSSLLGIMRVLKVSPANCKRPPHIVTDPNLDLVWKTRVGGLATQGNKKVALVWAGDPRHGNDHARSLKLSNFLRFCDVPGIDYFSFQVGEGARQLYANPTDVRIIEVGDDFRNFDDTASALRQMDLLISCDTSVAHLAGCMGVPCWVLVPHPPEWRWMSDVSESPWYESVRLFRQAKPRVWDPVVLAIREALSEFALRGSNVKP